MTQGPCGCGLPSCTSIWCSLDLAGFFIFCISIWVIVIRQDVVVDFPILGVTIIISLRQQCGINEILGQATDIKVF